MNFYVQLIAYLVILVVLAIPLGAYMARVYEGKKTFLSPVLDPIERGINKMLGLHETDQMDWKQYTASVFAFSFIFLVFLTLLQMVQKFLPLNPQDLDNVSWHLAFNTAASFVTNTNWQAYSGESTLSYLSQSLGLTVQNFTSAATGIAVLFALFRGFIQTGKNGLGSFWTDMVKVVVQILLPLNLVIAIALAAGGVVQNIMPGQEVQLVEPIAIDKDGKTIDNAKVDLASNTVTLDGKPVADATIVSKQFLPMGPGASQIAIKQTGTNGGGFYGVNSAHPLENPSVFTNLLEMISLLLIPVALCFTFGTVIRNNKQGVAIFAAMFILLVVGLGIIAGVEHAGTSQLAQGGLVDLSSVGQAGGNMEGKETRFGIATSATWASFTTAASNGSVNSMHDSYTPFGGMIELLQMQLGEVVFGGVGCGLYGMLGFAILTVFIAGLMVGRTPEFLGKKIEPLEMKYAVLVCLATPIGILVGAGIAAAVPEVANSVNNPGIHGFSELLYAYTSAGGNNGSAFAGFNANTPFLNVTIGLVMLFVRFLPIFGIMAIAGSLTMKKRMAVTAGTLSTTNSMFVFLLIFVVLLVGALSFFPALSLGPIAEFFTAR